MNPYFRQRDKHLKKAAKHYARAVEMHYNGIWLDHVNSMTAEQHKEVESLHKEYQYVKEECAALQAYVTDLNKTIKRVIKETK